MFSKLKFLIGVGLSSNYEMEKMDFTIGCWKVYDATHKYNKQRVSLWILDHEFLNKRFPDSKDQTSYINGYMTCINNSRKLIHPHILRIYDAQLDSYYFEFTSEHVTSCLKQQVGKLDSTDASYVAFQLLDALSFLHNTTKKVHFGVSTSSIFLDENFNAKLFNFNWLSEIQSDNTVKLPFTEYSVTPAYPNIKYLAPEVILAKSCYAQTDIFSFATVFCELLTGKQLLNYSKKEEYQTSVNPISQIQGMTTNFYQLLSNCLQPSPTLRPLTSELLKEPAFNTVSVKILRYFDMIMMKDPQDKFEFYKSLPKAMGAFSQKLLEAKIIPNLVEECHRNVKFAPVLLPTIFQAGKYFPIEEFTKHVFEPVEFLIPVLDPPQIAIAFLQSMDVIISGTDPSIHESRVYPILFSALKSTDIVLKEALKRLPTFISKISLNGLQKNILPLLIQIGAKSENPRIISSAFQCVKLSISRVDNDQFLKYLLPKIYDIWMQKQEPLIVPALSEILLAINGSESSLMAYAIPLAAEMLSSSNCHIFYQKQIASWMLATVTKYQTVRKLNEVEEPRPIQQISTSTDSTTTMPTNLTTANLMELFDPLAQELNLAPSQQVFDFTFQTVKLSTPATPQRPSTDNNNPQNGFSPSFDFSMQLPVNSQQSPSSQFQPDFGSSNFSQNNTFSSPLRNTNMQTFSPNFPNQNNFNPDFTSTPYNLNPNQSSMPNNNKDLRNLF